MTELHCMNSECNSLISEVNVNRTIGSIFFSVFGTAWLILWYFSYEATRAVLPAILVIGIALMLAATIYPHLTNVGPANPLGTLCAGLILWAGAVASLLHTGHDRKAAKVR